MIEKETDITKIMRIGGVPHEKRKEEFKRITGQSVEEYVESHFLPKYHRGEEIKWR
jgi:hypothetical protein